MNTQLPDGYEALFTASFGKDARENYVQCMNLPYVRGLRINPLRSSEPPLSFTREIAWNPDSYIIDMHDRIGNDPLHAAGVVYLQEPTAMAPVAALNPLPGEYVLDLCAAPGGKTTQIGARMNNDGFLLANDNNRTRAQALAQNVERMGLTHTTVASCAPEKLCQAYRDFFDAILVDAPCSGEGMFRREPEAKALWTTDRVKALAQTQLAILNSAYSMLSDGGRMVYSTCTFNPVENECVVAAFLAMHPNMTLEPVSLPMIERALSAADLTDAARKNNLIMQQLNQLPDDWSSVPTEFCARFFPFHSPGEGHFIALMRKNGSANAYARPERRGNSQRLSDKKLVSSFLAFAKDVLTPAWLKEFQGALVFASQKNILYAVHPQLPELPAYLRKGVPLLRLMHTQPAPEHALAMILRPQDVIRHCPLSYGDQRVLDFLAGHPIACAATDGWCLVHMDGAPLGWGKVSQGTLKNHYPKGLRRQYEFAR